MKRPIKYALNTLVVVAIFLGALSISIQLHRSSADPTNGVALHFARSEKSLDIYVHEFKELPPAEAMNKAIQNYSENTPLDENASNRQRMIHMLANDISSWHFKDSLPIYIQTGKSPKGYGFYYVGEDGVSNSNGNDPDDLNSWDESSFNYYTKPHKKMWSIKVFATALFLTLVVLGMMYYLYRISKTPVNTTE